MKERHRQKRYTDKELIGLFPGVAEIIRDKLVEWSSEYDRQVKVISDILITVEKDAPQDIWFYEIFIKKLFVPDLLKTENHIFRLKRLLSVAEGNTGISRRREDFEERKTVAKNYPIDAVAQRQIALKPSGKNFVGLCPLHQEKTPSFYLYTETNSFYCFGCHAGGDVITLTMQLYGLGFTDAVAMLNK